MKKYYYFPKSYEEDIREKEDMWLSMKPTGYIIVTGVYSKSLNPLNDTKSLVYNKNILNEINFISNGFVSENNEVFELIGYCLEADLQTYSPQWQALIDSYEDVKQFNTSEEYLEFINNK